MIELIAQDEAAPASYPNLGGLTAEAEATAWQRVEHYTAHRWSERAVIWTVRGPGEFVPPLRPVVSLTAEVWDGAAYIAATLDAAPRGYGLPLEGPYRITATVGAGPVPEAVVTAAQRLAAYLAAEDAAPGGARSYSANVGQLSESIDRDPAHLGRAMQNSGAADLLRPYRRA
jgi:hypothetical protein